MIIHPAKQGSPDWVRARIGLPTASNFDRIITKSGKPSASADRYLARLAAEWYMGECLDEAVTAFMERGRALEAEAVGYYTLTTGQPVREVGLCLRDDGAVGASPDRLVGDDGLLEVKCPSAEVHMTYVLGGVTDEYRIQQQGQLWITGRKWCDLLCFHPTLPDVRVRVERDDEFIRAMASLVDEFVGRLTAAKAKLAKDKADYEQRLEDDVPAMLSS